MTVTSSDRCEESVLRQISELRLAEVARGLEEQIAHCRRSRGEYAREGNEVAVAIMDRDIAASRARLRQIASR